MKSNFPKYLALALVLLTIIAVGACAKPETTPPPETPKPAEFVITELAISPDIVMPSDEVTVTATINNTGGTEGTYTAILTLDGQELERKDVLVGPGATNTAVFKFTSPETSGSYTLNIGQIMFNLPMFPWVAHTIQYDNARAAKYATSYMGYGWLSHFEIPSTTFRIKDINIYGYIWGTDLTGLGERSFTLRIWDNTLSQELYSQSYPYNLFTTYPAAAWVKVEVPDLRVDSDFYVEVVTNAEEVVGKVKCGLCIGLDLSATEGNADEIFNGVIQPWDTTAGAKETTAWMVRVDGERGPRVEEHLLSYDDGIPEGGHYTGVKSYLIHFSPPSQPFRITQVLICGWIQADSPADYQNREFSVKVYNKAGEELWNQNFLWQLFRKDEASWAELDVPNLSVSDDFYVEVTTYSAVKTTLNMDYDASTPNEHSDMSLNGKIIPWEPFTYEGVEYTREKVNWMIRVVGTAMMPEG
jgi:hypothetical protein